MNSVARTARTGGGQLAIGTPGFWCRNPCPAKERSVSKRRASMAVTLAVFGVALSACGGSTGTRSGGGSSVTATEQEFSITLSTGSVQGGNVGIKTRNTGKANHELVVFRTDLGEGALPLGPDGKVDEKGAGITHLDPEAEDVTPGKTKAITVDLAPGRYVLVCNLPGHYTQGMHAVLTVT